MAHDYQLKAIVLGLENWAYDNVKLAEFLEMRRLALPTPPPLPPAFTKTNYVPPTMPYPSVTASLKTAADLLDHVADRNDDTATYLKATPIIPTKPVPPVVKTVPTREERIRLIVHWLSTISGIFKSTLRLYGLDPEPIPPPPNPGPKREELQFAEIAAWILKIGKDADSFATAQRITPVAGKVPYDTSGEGPALDDSLVRIELATHKLAHDIGAIAAILPYHLLRAVQ